MLHTQLLSLNEIYKDILQSNMSIITLGAHAQRGYVYVVICLCVCPCLNIPRGNGIGSSARISSACTFFNACAEGSAFANTFTDLGIAVYQYSFNSITPIVYHALCMHEL